MVSNGDIEMGEVAASPCPLLLPFPRASVRRPERAEEGDHEILVEGVADEPYPAAPHGGQEGRRIESDLRRRRSIRAAGLRDPDPRIDRLHPLPAVPEAVPGIPVEWTAPVVPERPPAPLPPSPRGFAVAAETGSRRGEETEERILAVELEMDQKDNAEDNQREEDDGENTGGGSSRRRRRLRTRRRSPPPRPLHLRYDLSSISRAGLFIFYLNNVNIFKFYILFYFFCAVRRVSINSSETGSQWWEPFLELKEGGEREIDRSLRRWWGRT